MCCEFWTCYFFCISIFIPLRSFLSRCCWVNDKSILCLYVFDVHLSRFRTTMSQISHRFRFFLSLFLCVCSSTASCFWFSVFMFLMSIWVSSRQQRAWFPIDSGSFYLYSFAFVPPRLLAWFRFRFRFRSFAFVPFHLLLVESMLFQFSVFMFLMSIWVVQEKHKAMLVRTVAKS